MTACPEHPDTELRPEYSSELGRTGFCTKCPKHYKLCSITYGTWGCDKVKDHPGNEHVTSLPGGHTHVWGPIT